MSDEELNRRMKLKVANIIALAMAREYDTVEELIKSEWFDWIVDCDQYCPYDLYCRCGDYEHGCVDELLRLVEKDVMQEES